jgi:hypothetical protein
MKILVELRNSEPDTELYHKSLASTLAGVSN